MGAQPWHYFTTYNTDIYSALQNLREQEFRAGRYGQNSVDIWGNDGEYASNSEDSAEQLIQEFGSVEASIQAVFEESQPEGTASILDIFEISDVPSPCAICSLCESDLQESFGTNQPTREIVEALLIDEQDPEVCEAFWNSIGRGEGRYIVLYQEAEPSEIFFAGYSFD